MPPLPMFLGGIMRIDRMVEGGLYKIKPNIHVYEDNRAGPHRKYRVLAGYRDRTISSLPALPPFLYLGYKIEDWKYHYQHTNKVHYIMLGGDVWVMDNQFAKHIVPVWKGDENGED